MERPSDMQRLIYIPYNEDLAREAGVLRAKGTIAQGHGIVMSRL